MKGEWQRVKLGEVVKLVIDYRGKTPKKLGREWAESGYRALSAKSVKTRQIINEEAIHFADDKLYSLWMKEEIRRGDILITSEAPFGQVYYWNTDEKIVLSQRLFALRCNDDVCSSYVFQYMTGAAFQAELSARATGTTVTGLRQPELLKCEISLPPLPTQRRIASVLGALDDKIELNRKMNANLEAQAQALFKSWFVDFAPWGGKMPAGWKKGTLGEIAEVVGGGTPSKSRDEYYTENGIAWLTPKDLSITHAKFTSHGAIDITQEGYDNSSAKLMPRGSVLFSSRAPIGYLTIAENEICTNQGFKSLVSTSHAGTAFLYYYMFFNTDRIERMSSGSTFKEASGSLIKSLELFIPEESTLDRFEVTIKPIFEQQKVFEHQSRKLAELRDALLPKLMSGELSVSAAEPLRRDKEVA